MVHLLDEVAVGWQPVRETGRDTGLAGRGRGRGGRADHQPASDLSNY